MSSLVRITGICYTIVAYDVQFLLGYDMLYNGRDWILHFVGICYYSLLGLMLRPVGIWRYPVGVLWFNLLGYVTLCWSWIFGYILLRYYAKISWDTFTFCWDIMLQLYLHLLGYDVTNNSSSLIVPFIITNRSPGVVDLDFNSTIHIACSIHQSHRNISNHSCQRSKSTCI